MTAPAATRDSGLPLGFAIPDWRPPTHPPRDPMQGRYCRVEALDAAVHADALHAANAVDTEGEMWTYLSYGPFESVETYRDWMNATCRGSAPLFFAIVELETGRPAGVASYSHIEPAAGTIEVGHLAYSPLLQRSPAATEAMFLMMQNVFELGYRRYEWRCNSLNARSRAAAERLGFTYEGLFRQQNVHKGRNRDTAWLSVIDSEWPALKAAFVKWLAPENFDAAGKQKARLSDLTRAALQAAG